MRPFTTDHLNLIARAFNLDTTGSEPANDTPQLVAAVRRGLRAAAAAGITDPAEAVVALLMSAAGGRPYAVDDTGRVGLMKRQTAAA